MSCDLELFINDIGDVVSGISGKYKGLANIVFLRHSVMTISLRSIFNICCTKEIDGMKDWL